MTSNTWHPEREIEIVAGTPPGGGLDRSARALVKAIESNRLLEVPVRVNNVAGDGGRKAWAYLEQHRADPHVVSISSANLTTDHLLGSAAFRHEAAFTPLAILYTEYIAFVARADSALKSGADLLARVRADAGSLTIALSTSLGNPNHIAVAKVLRQAGTEVRAPAMRVFDSALDATADVVAGRADIGAVTAASPVREIANGTLRALAVSAPRRLDGLYANTPTWREQSVDCVIGAWRGVTGTRGITAAQIAFWEKLLAAIAATDEWKAELARHYWTAMPLAGGPLWDHLERERAEMQVALGELGLLRGMRDEG
ncbi:MAG: tripartite tricarboxylate transporter substrate binding protein [Betaproteobacteria bacterium]|nr:tripartite tricarboxylate transporter substrate binding protein [Betaproteobacteria bacterium]MDH3437167.1 tripartite tricarboxylate transporter substrate binding protein [Betaproteobacteria bacterium]